MVLLLRITSNSARCHVCICTYLAHVIYIYIVYVCIHTCVSHSVFSSGSKVKAYQPPTNPLPCGQQEMLEYIFFHLFPLCFSFADLLFGLLSHSPVIVARTRNSEIYSASTRLLSRIILKSIHSLHQSRGGNFKRSSESLKNKKKKKSHYVACPYYIKSSTDSDRILPIRPEVKHWEQ